MDLFYKIAAAALCLFFIWQIVRVIKSNPELMSKENLSKSFLSMGVLALILIGAVVMMVLLLKSN